VCPGVCMTSTFSVPASRTSPSSSRRSNCRPSVGKSRDRLNAPLKISWTTEILLPIAALELKRSLSACAPGEVVGVDMGIQHPMHLQVLCGDEAGDLLDGVGEGAPGGGVQIQHRIDDHGILAVLVVHYVGQGVGATVVEECFYLHAVFLMNLVLPDGCCRCGSKGRSFAVNLTCPAGLTFVRSGMPAVTAMGRRTLCVDLWSFCVTHPQGRRVDAYRYPVVGFGNPRDAARQR
jgi:hypothetical protein